MDSRNDSYIDPSSSSPKDSVQPDDGYQPVQKRDEFRINAAIQPKTFNKIVIAAVAGSVAVGVFVVIKLLLLLSWLF